MRSCGKNYNLFSVSSYIMGQCLEIFDHCKILLVPSGPLGNDKKYFLLFYLNVASYLKFLAWKMVLRKRGRKV